ncbi:MAG: hypothetical protein ACRECI_08055 [Methyloceanibacter sp.]
MIGTWAKMEVGRPVPGRRVGLGTLVFGVLAAPIAWWLALFSLYAIASHNCFPGGSPRATALWNAQWVLAAIGVAALVICVIAGLVSYRSWRETYGDLVDRDRLVQFGEGRSRFLAMWGALTGLLFAILMVVSLIPLVVIPLCASWG